MIQGGLNPGLSGMVAPGPLTGGDLSDIPLPQLGQLAQQSGNPALSAAAMQELARRGADNKTALHDPSSPMSPLGAVANGAVAAPGQLPPVIPASQTNPAMDAIATGVTAADATAGRVPSYVDQGVPSSGAADNTVNPALAAAAQPSAATSIGDLMKNVPTDITPEDKWLALAKGFSTMAASKQPGFLGAIGEGAGAATDALRQDQDQAIRNRIFGVESGQRQEGIDESSRSNRIQEGQGDTRIKQAQQALTQAQQQFEFEKQKYEQGIGSETALKLAQIAAARAATNYSEVAAEAAKAGEGQLVQTDQGFGQISGNTFKPVLGPDGKPVNQQYRPTAIDTRYQLLTDAGIPASEAALIVANSKPATAVQIETAASNAGKNAAAGLFGDAAAQAYQQEYARVKEVLTGGAAAMPAPAGAPAPQQPAAAPQTATNPKTGEKVQWNGSAWVPVK